ncbi:MAG: Dam family site-specific DNA-(adenine-N6)-methyltransferase [Thermodesulfovibrionales bacterium]|nr:Dam family site-specific DNA-(adenine-N6)-methyltransferase [Thermodesulfovibrionales bacterium]
MQCLKVRSQPQLTIKPFLKWAGGKRWLVSKHDAIFPKEYKRYFEPFLGSGAIFFSLAPSRAYLSDVNANLIEVYTAVRDDWRAVWNRLLWHSRHHNKEHYYGTRASKPGTAASRAAKFIYLNRTCFNGLYRVNRKGIFNVPKGTKNSVIFPDDSFEKIANLLRSAQIVCSDFEESIDKTGIGDFIYIDPPYTVKHNMNNFIKYNELLFSWEDQERLATAATKASKRGALVLISNADSKYIKRLYSNDEWNHIVLSRHSIIASAACKRQTTTELAIANYNLCKSQQNTALFQ